MESIPTEEWSSHVVGEICTRSLVTALPEETLGAALRRMGIHDIGRLPVVDPRDGRRLLGWLRRPDLIRAYDLALTRRTALRHRAQQVRLGAISRGNVRVEEITVQPGSACDGKHVREVSWPKDCIIASLHSSRNVIIPNGDTVLRAEDILVMVFEGEAGDEV